MYQVLNIDSERDMHAQLARLDGQPSKTNISQLTIYSYICITFLHDEKDN